MLRNLSPPPSLPVKPIYNLEAAGGGTLLRDTKIRSSSISSLFGLHIKFYLSNFVCSLSLSLSLSQMYLTRGEVLRERESDIERERERERRRGTSIFDRYLSHNKHSVCQTYSFSFILSYFLRLSLNLLDTFSLCIFLNIIQPLLFVSLL